MRNLRNRDGFTLIELMIVVVIIGILAAIAIPKFSQVSKSSKEAEAPSVMKQIRNLTLAYYQKTDLWPTARDGATNIPLSLSGFTNPQAKYYDFSLVSGGTATAITVIEAKAAGAGVGAQVITQCMNAETGAITELAYNADCTAAN